MGHRILVLNDTKDAGVSYSPMLKEFGEVTNTHGQFLVDPKAFKLVQFTGGSDVTPSFYSDIDPTGLCKIDPERDKLEESVFKVALKNDVKMAGICRGMQFLNAMCGGKMIHHLSGHSGAACAEHEVSTTCGGSFMVNTLHHQACILPKHAFILVWSTKRLSKQYVGDKDKRFTWLGPEIEAFYAPANKVIGVQWHPEAMEKDQIGRKYYMGLIDNYLSMTTVGFQSKYINEGIEIKEVKTLC